MGMGIGMGMGMRMANCDGDGDGDAEQAASIAGGSPGLAGRHLRHLVAAGAAGSERLHSPPAARTLFSGPFHGGGKGN